MSDVHCLIPNFPAIFHFLTISRGIRLYMLLQVLCFQHRVFDIITNSLSCPKIGSLPCTNNITGYEWVYASSLGKGRFERDNLTIRDLTSRKQKVPNTSYTDRFAWKISTCLFDRWNLV